MKDVFICFCIIVFFWFTELIFLKDDVLALIFGFISLNIIYLIALSGCRDND